MVVETRDEEDINGFPIRVLQFPTIKYRDFAANRQWAVTSRRFRPAM